MIKLHRFLATGLAALLVSGCAFQPVQPGAARADVLSRYGSPSAELTTASGTRLQYSRQPFGHSVVNVDLDSSGRVVSVRELMNPAAFGRVEVGKWSRADVEREFGRPAIVDRVASWPGDVMSYRWRDVSQPMFFYVYLDAGNVVQRTGQGMEFPAEVREN
ncbi:MAG: hypothetical protein V4772_28480 [Pseudomonadota bacterium]